MSHPVTLYVYDLAQGMARAMSMSVIGIQIDIIPHTGIAVYGREYFFSGGIQSLPETDFAKSHGMPVHETVMLGATEVPQELFEEFLLQVNDEYTAATYDLLRHNCNHFTEAAAQFLVGKSIPAPIRELPEKVLATPMGQMFAQMFQQAANGFDPLAQQPSLAGGGPLNPAAALQSLATPARPNSAQPPPPTPTAPATDRKPPTPTAPATERKPSLPSSTPAGDLVTKRGPPPTPAATPSGPLFSPPAATPATRPVRPARAPPSSLKMPAVTETPDAPGGGGARGIGIGLGSGKDSSGGGRGRGSSGVGPGKLSVTPLATPAAPLNRAPHLYPNRQPLTSAGGPSAAVLKLVLEALVPPRASALDVSDAAAKATTAVVLPLPAEEAEAFSACLRAGLDDPNLIDADKAKTLAVGFTALLRAWPPPNQKHFGCLYLMRLITAASDPFGDALLDTSLLAELTDPSSGVLGGKMDALEGPLTSARGARLMALALVANLAAASPRARRLVCAEAAEAVVSAAARSMECGSGDAALGQMGAAVSLNLILHLASRPDAEDEPDGREPSREALAAAEESVAPSLLTATLSAVVGLTDTEAAGRALSCIGHLLAAESDDVFACAVSLDAAATLDGLRDRAEGQGHDGLLRDVRTLLPRC